MKTSALMITTDLPNRLHLLDAALKSVDRNCSKFDQKVLTIDFIANEPSEALATKLFGCYRYRGWQLVYGKCSGHRGMANNISRGLSVVTGDVVFYSEDDIIVNRIPGVIDYIFTAMPIQVPFLCKSIGYVCYNTHVHDLAATYGQVPKVVFINNKDNYVKVGSDTFLVKKPMLKDNYYLNMPVMITRADTFRKLLAHAWYSCRGMGMEPALTKAWFDLGFDKTLDVVTYVKPDIFSAMPLTINKFYHQANMQFWNNDEGLRHPSINDRQNTIF